MEKLEEEVEICLNLKMAIAQRKSELENNFGYSGTRGFEEFGCYNCDGKDILCGRYLID